MFKIKIDAGARTFLPICSCGWRGLPSLDRRAALSESRHHELRAHPGNKNALRQLTAYNHRKKEHP